MLKLFVVFQMLPLYYLMDCKCVIFRIQPFSTANGFLVFVTKGCSDLATSKGLTFCINNPVAAELRFHLRSFSKFRHL